MLHRGVKIDRELTGSLDVSKRRKAKKQARHSVTVAGVRYPLLQDPRSKVWRIRKRSKKASIDESLGVLNLEEAKAEAEKRLSKEHKEKARLSSGGATLPEIIQAYREMPKRCTPDTAEANIKRLERVVWVAWGRKPEEVLGSDLSPDLWEDYAVKRQKGKVLDLSTRTEENRGINSAIRMASSVFHDGLAIGYKKAGITLDLETISRVRWLPEIKVKVLPLPADPITEMHKALKKLKVTDRPMWRAISIAEHAGLRSNEISAARKSWLEKSPHTGEWRFGVRDRPAEGYWHKTGEDYVAPILSKELERDLLKCSADGPLVPVKGSRDYFFRHLCSRWLRDFIPKPHKTMHRLRALYLERIRDERAAEIRAQDEGTEAARKAAGHTSSKTTKRHYLPAS